MGLLDLLSEMPLFLSSDDSRNRKKKNRIIETLAVLLILIGTVWFVRELPDIKGLNKPMLFIGLSVLGSLIVSILLILLLFTVRILDSVTSKDFVLIVLSVSFNLVCAISYLNRIYDYKIMKAATVAEENLSVNKAHSQILD